VHELKSQMLTFSTKVDGMISEIGRGFADISAFIKVINDEQIALNQALQARSLSSFTTPPGSLQTEVQDLKNKVDLLQAAMPVNSGFASGNTTSSEEASSLKIQLKLLEARLPTHNLLRLGGNVFQSRADVALFVENKIPSNAYSMFHDFVTLMEHL
jgi:hypothetical protein